MSSFHVIILQRVTITMLLSLLPPQPPLQAASPDPVTWTMGPAAWFHLPHDYNPLLVTGLVCQYPFATVPKLRAIPLSFRLYLPHSTCMWQFRPGNSDLSVAAGLREPRQIFHSVWYIAGILSSYYSSSWLNDASCLTWFEYQEEFVLVYPISRVFCPKIRLWEEWHHLYKIKYFFLPLLYVPFASICVWLQGVQ